MTHRKQARRKPKPASYAIISGINSLAAVLADLDPEEAARRIEEAEAPLDALALEDPKEATLIYNACPNYFDEDIEPDEYYLGQGVYIEKAQLAELDTAEKRAAYIAAINADAAAALDQSEAGPFTFTGGEPIKLEGITQGDIKLR